ncbi:U6 snRNA phosphodiesterase 1 [Bicyclus anynana]|uniref:U6 snRNA phosphodiesterase n=1 Tax=Bicyclus anynana TaxID=110368 RepID=A0ABM3LRG2_BICAN|nr:U6 snRNA phosphodiesterase 1 [Bicyclus anynana]
MSGLSYISEYGDEEDSHSEEEYEEIQEKACSKPRLPQPNLTGVPVVSFEEHVDDSNLHGGRVRSFPHVRGNWATFVYIDYPDKENLLKLIDKFATTLATVDESCSKCEDIHISLSKTFVLKYHMINTFTSSLQEVLKNIDSFELGFESVDVFCNEDKTRTFIALKVDCFAHRYLISITKKIDNILRDFRLPEFYNEPSFHMSILSINGDKKQCVLKILHQLNQHFMNQEEKVDTIIINKVNCKSGNKYYQYYLK